MDEPLTGDIHILDGKLTPHIHKVDYKGTPEDIDKIKELTNLPLSPEALNVLGILINEIGTANNYDNINNVSIDNLLFELASFIPTFNSDNIELLNIYLIEMKTGLCAQGRSHRLRMFLFLLD